MALVNIYGNRDLYDAALLEMDRYQTGRAITTFLAEDARPFDVVVLNEDEHYGQLLVNGEISVQAQTAFEKFRGLTGRAQLDRPTVFWNPTYRFDYFGNVRGLGVNGYGEIQARLLRDTAVGELCYRFKTRKVPGPGFTYNEIPVAYATQGAMEPWIVLAHELGHAKQYYTPPDLDADGLAQACSARLANTDAIEAENLAQHENPICRQHGIPIRANYKHSGLGMLNALQSYSGPNKAPALLRAQDMRDATRKLANASIQAKAAPTPLGEYTGFFFKR